MEKRKKSARHRYGYACINMDLADKGITTNSSMILKTFMDKGVKYAGELAHSNLVALQKVLEWNVANGIEVYRMTSKLFPWASEYKLEDLPNWSDILPIMEDIGKYCDQHKLRLSFHPGPYNNLGSPDLRVIKSSIVDLEMHSQIMDYLGRPNSHEAKINIHLGGAYGDKEAAIERFNKNFELLSSGLKTRLTLENDDRESLYSVADLYKAHEATGIAIVFDGHHWQVGAQSGTYQEDLLLAYKTWGDVIPTLHWSNSRSKWEDPKAKVNAHTDWYYETMSLPNLDCDVILESKMKERALLKYVKEIMR